MDKQQGSESRELRREWEAITSVLPALSLSPRALIYVCIGWAAVSLFFVWLPIVFVYAAVFVLWHLGRLFSGAFLKAGDILRRVPEETERAEPKKSETKSNT
jgi:hypothetical protein